MTGLTEDKAIALARQVAYGQGWPWLEPVRARLQRSGFSTGPSVWVVTTNDEFRGMNVRIVLDAYTGDVREKGYIPR